MRMPGPAEKQNDFRELCHCHRLAATHQRQLIYEAVMGMAGHPSPEAIYDRVKKELPSLSLATVYKNVRTFLASGILREVSLHHGSLRVETNRAAHHHLVCTRCKSITDLEENSVRTALSRGKLPRGFAVSRIAIDVVGVCQKCARARPLSEKRLVGPRPSILRMSRPRSSGPRLFTAPRSQTSC